MIFRLRSAHFAIELPPGTSYLGRGTDCLVHLEQGLVSRRHARLEVGSDGVTIEDLGSVNGTYVNGVLVTVPRRLQSGDRILIGSEEMSLTSDAVTPVPASRLPPAVADPAGRTRRPTTASDPVTLIAEPESADLKRRSMGPFLVELVEKAIGMMRFDEAARLVGALGSSLKGLDLTSPDALQGIVRFTEIAVRLAEASRQWAHVDRVFEVAAARRWPLPDAFFRSLDQLRALVQPHMGPGVSAYLQLLERGVAKGTRGLAPQLARLKAVLGQP